MSKQSQPLVKKVLLVEDNPLNQKIQKMMLESLNCEVDVAGRGQKALEMINDSYDLVFMDIGLPDVNGIQVTETIRGRGGFFAEVPIVAMTAHVREKDRQLAIDAGMNDVLHKPVLINQLESLINGFNRHTAVA